MSILPSRFVSASWSWGNVCLQRSHHLPFVHHLHSHMITVIIVSNQGGCLLSRPVEMLGIHELQQLPEQNNHHLRLNTKCDDRDNRSPVIS